MQMKKFAIYYLLVASTFQLLVPTYIQAQTPSIDAGFDPNRILEDEDIFDANGMSYERMVSFLRSKGALADYITIDIDGVPKTAAEIIWRVSQTYKMNPKYLLVLLQKEQSLVEDPSPSQRQMDWAAGYGVCDSCSKNDPSIQDFKGFASQLEWAAKQHREKYLFQILMKGRTIAGKAPGQAIPIDGMIVTPVNNATVMLYSYTPHIHGNLNLWRIWHRWFSLTFPDGSVVRGKPSGTTYLIRLGQKRPFASPVVMASMVDENKIIETSDTELAAYADGSLIQFPKYALLKDPQNRIWLLSDTGLRHIASMEIFNKFGFNLDEVIEVEEEDIIDYPVAKAIDENTQFPQGVLLQDKVSKKVWYVDDEGKHLIAHPTILALYFKNWKPKQVTTKTLDTYATAPDYTFHNAELVKGEKSTAVYVMDGGALRAIPSAEIFESMGWKWKNIVTVPDKLISSYPIGDIFDLKPVASVASAASEPTPTASTTPMI
ncbi:MAG: hypothetical protein RDU25_03620 [Patescibacteria group bacterium]|nr:hypothetical protein [Patescibacteria group bacterium]